MSHKKTLCFQCCFLFLACWAGFAQQMPVEVKNALANAPEDVLVGVGFAKADSDWESFMLAQDRARVSIATALSSMVQNMVRDYTVKKLSDSTATPEDSDENTHFEENLTLIYSDVHIRGAKTVVLAKTDDGTWWCVIYYAKKNILVGIDPQGENSEGPLLASIILPDIGSVRTVSSASEWINERLGRREEDVLYGIGAARMENGAFFANEALSRARTSLGHSLHSEVTSSARYYEAKNSAESIGVLNEITTVISSEYQYIDMPIRLIDLAKTNDNTLWVILGCKVETTVGGYEELPVQQTESLERKELMYEALEMAKTYLGKVNAAWETGQTEATARLRLLIAAQKAARLAVPAMASFDAEARMSEAFDQAIKEELAVPINPSFDAEARMNERFEQLRREGW